MKNSVPGAVIIEGHVQGLSNTRSLGEIGIPVYVVDVRKCIASGSRYCKKFFICPDFQSEDFIEFLIDIAKRENLNGWVMIPSNDHIVINLAKNKARLEQYYKVITSELPVIENIYDKAALLKIASHQNIPVPVTQYFESESESILTQLRYPVLTKGRNGLTFYKTFKKKAFLSNNEDELRKHLKIIALKYKLSATFTQEMIPFYEGNKTVSFTAFCDNGEIKTYWMGVKIREHPFRFGTATFAKSVYVQECLDQSKPLLKALKYTGVCEVEYIKDPRSDEYKLIEINARTWLWVGLAKACGVNYAKIIYDFANGRDIKYPSFYDFNKYWLNPITDTVYSLTSILKRKLSLIEYLKSFRKISIVDALFIKNDLRPGFNYLFNLSSICRKR